MNKLKNNKTSRVFAVDAQAWVPVSHCDLVTFPPVHFNGDGNKVSSRKNDARRLYFLKQNSRYLNDPGIQRALRSVNAAPGGIHNAIDAEQLAEREWKFFHALCAQQQAEAEKIVEDLEKLTPAQLGKAGIIYLQKAKKTLKKNRAYSALIASRKARHEADKLFHKRQRRR